MPQLLMEIFDPVSPNYVYRCLVTRVVDGDTVDVSIDLGFDTWIKDRVRLMGIDTPESRTRNRKEKALGLAAKARLKEFIKNAHDIPGKRGKKEIYLQTSKEGKGKFGRILGSILVNGQNLNLAMIREGHARQYFGGSKNELGPWTVEKPPGVWHRWTSEGYVAYDA